MIRRLIVVIMTMASLSTAMLGWASFVAPTHQMLPMSERLCGYVYFADGLVRFYWYHGSVGIRLEPANNFRRIRVFRARDGSLWQDIRHARLGRVRPNAMFSQLVRAPSGIGTDRLRMIGVRFHMFWLVALLLVYPITRLARIRVSRHGHRKGHCIHCHYDLRGSTSDICPECGQTSRCPGCEFDLSQVSRITCPQCGLEIASVLGR